MEGAPNSARCQLASNKSSSTTARTRPPGRHHNHSPLLILSVILLKLALLAHLTSCQTIATTDRDQNLNSRHHRNLNRDQQHLSPLDELHDEQPLVGRGGSGLPPVAGCNQQRSEEARGEQIVKTRTSASREPRNQRFAQQKQQQQLVKQHRMLETSASERQHLSNGRQQRQFGPASRSAAMLMASQNAADVQPATGSAPSNQPVQAQQPEEFSLVATSSQQNNAPTANNGQQTPASIRDEPMMMSASSTNNQIVVAPPPPNVSSEQQHNLTGSGYTLVSTSEHQQPPAPQVTGSNVESGETTTTTTTTVVSATLGSTNGVAQKELLANDGSAATTTQVALGAERAPTTPVISGELLGAPVAPQPPPMTTTMTTASSSPSSSSKQAVPTTTTASSGATRQQGRRMEENSSFGAERHSSSGAPPPSRHAISSSPSSMSIITPLIGPPQATPTSQAASIQPASQQQATSSSMIKPIYVLGNPIGELDYTSTAYEQQQKASAATANRMPGQRLEKRVDEHQQLETQYQQALFNNNNEQQQQATVLNATLFNGDATGERMNGPALVYSDGRLVDVAQETAATLQANASQSSEQHQAAVTVNNHPHQVATSGPNVAAAGAVPPPSPRLFQGNQQGGGAGGAAVLNNNPRRPSLPPPVNQEKAASGFRSPLSPSGPLIGQPVAGSSANAPMPPMATNSMLQQPANNNNNNNNLAQMMGASQMPNFYQTSPPYGGGAAQLFAANMASQQAAMSNKQAFVLNGQQQQIGQQIGQPQQQQGQVLVGSNGTATATGAYQSRRPLNITRVEHISAECSNDLIRAVIVFNGTFKGIIYSSGYVNDPTCLYVNGSGLTRYEFSIRLNQCGTLGRQEMHQPAMPGEARRKDQVMWNTLSIQYNPVIEQEWDEHFRVSCEYGSDFWKTISFSPFNVETNTGSPVVFTINPPQCQMDVLLGHGMGPKIAVDGPVTVGDPLTLLIHMKSEKAGYDILVKNCVAHNGGKQRMQLIDLNGCVVNERFISPFRGTYNDNDLRHVTLYAYLKAFRFTGSPVLYLECEIHMCQSACPPQMCYWRRLSKRSVDNSDFEYTDERNGTYANSTGGGDEQAVISDSLSLFKALQVRQEPVEPARARQRAQALQEIYAEDEEAQLVCYRHAEVLVFMITLGSLLLLLLSIAITCCLRIRKLAGGSGGNHKLQQRDGHFQHSGSSSGSLSPSLLSIASGSALSFGLTQAAPSIERPHKAASANNQPVTRLQQVAATNNKSGHPFFHLNHRRHSPTGSFAFER